MIETPEVIPLSNVESRDAFIGVNFNQRMTNFMKLRIDDKEITIPVSSFMRIALMMAKEEEAPLLINVKKTKRRTFRKWQRIKIQKPMQPGQFIDIPCDFVVDLPDEVQLT